MLNFENIGERFTEVVHSNTWKELQSKYNKCNDIYVLGHGGNMSVADHTAVDFLTVKKTQYVRVAVPSRHHTLMTQALTNGWLRGYKPEPQLGLRRKCPNH